MGGAAEIEIQGQKRYPVKCNPLGVSVTCDQVIFSAGKVTVSDTRKKIGLRHLLNEPRTSPN